FRTGAAGGVLNQAKVAGHWHATANEVALVGGFLSSIAVAAGCFVAGWLSTRFHPQRAYVLIVIVFALVPISMAATPATPAMYVVWGIGYSFGLGLASPGGCRRCSTPWGSARRP